MLAPVVDQAMAAVSRYWVGAAEDIPIKTTYLASIDFRHVSTDREHCINEHDDDDEAS